MLLQMPWEQLAFAQANYSGHAAGMQLALLEAGFAERKVGGSREALCNSPSNDSTLV